MIARKHPRRMELELVSVQIDKGFIDLIEAGRNHKLFFSDTFHAELEHRFHAEGDLIQLAQRVCLFRRQILFADQLLQPGPPFFPELQSKLVLLEQHARSLESPAERILAGSKVSRGGVQLFEELPVIVGQLSLLLVPFHNAALFFPYKQSPVPTVRITEVGSEPPETCRRSLQRSVPRVNARCRWPAKCLSKTLTALVLRTHRDGRLIGCAMQRQAKMSAIAIYPPIVCVALSHS
jgi:hypothetical protein